MNKFKTYQPILIFLLLYGIIWLYFFNFKTDTIYGDDIFLYRDHFALKNIFDKLSFPRISEKFRPVWGLVLNFVLDLFRTDVYKYYLLNVGVQAINTFIFALIVDLFFNSIFYSAFVSLLFGFSRFALYNITQVCCGGLLEGLAMTFFLVTLYYIFCFFVKDKSTPGQNFRYLVYAIISANFSMNTHERYIVLFPFILLVVLLYPTKNKLSGKQKAIVCALAVLSIILNVAVKKYVYNYPFFVGTGGSYIKPTLISVGDFLSQGLQSIILINTGPESFIGATYNSLDRPYQAVVIAIVLLLLTLFVTYFINVPKYFRLKDRQGMNSFYCYLLLLILFVLCIVPAVVTIRLEQRWLQASFCILILMIVIAYYNIPIANATLKNVLSCVFIAFFLFSDHYYLTKTNAMFLKTEENIANMFKQAMLNGTIPQRINNLYIEEPRRGEDWREFNTQWAIGDGYDFEFYQGKSKKIFFVDPNKFIDTVQIKLLKDFNKETDQIISMQDKVVDVTNQYLEERSKRLNSGVK